MAHIPNRLTDARTLLYAFSSGTFIVVVITLVNILEHRSSINLLSDEQPLVREIMQTARATKLEISRYFFLVFEDDNSEKKRIAQTVRFANEIPKLYNRATKPLSQPLLASSTLREKLQIVSSHFYPLIATERSDSSSSIPPPHSITILERLDVLSLHDLYALAILTSMDPVNLHRKLSELSSPRSKLSQYSSDPIESLLDGFRTLSRQVHVNELNRIHTHALKLENALSQHADHPATHLPHAYDSSLSDITLDFRNFSHHLKKLHHDSPLRLQVLVPGVDQSFRIGQVITFFPIALSIGFLLVTSCLTYVRQQVPLPTDSTVRASADVGVVFTQLCKHDCFERMSAWCSLVVLVFGPVMLNAYLLYECLPDSSKSDTSWFPTILWVLNALSAIFGIPILVLSYRISRSLKMLPNPAQTSQILLP